MIIFVSDPWCNLLVISVSQYIGFCERVFYRIHQLIRIFLPKNAIFILSYGSVNVNISTA